MLVGRYCAGQVVFFSVHEPALNAAVESLYVPIATKTCKTAPHFSTLRLQGYSLNTRPTRSALVLWGHSTESSMARYSCKSYAYMFQEENRGTSISTTFCQRVRQWRGTSGITKHAPPECSL